MIDMCINAFARWVNSRRLPPAQPTVDAELFITVCGLVGELGEVLEHLKKNVRDGKELNLAAIEKEMGDQLFYWARACNHFGLKPTNIMLACINKIQGRIARGTERGSGDDR